MILIIFLGSQLVFRNEITLGELVAFHLLADKVAEPIMSLSTIWEQWQGLKIARLRSATFSTLRPKASVPNRLCALRLPDTEPEKHLVRIQPGSDNYS